MLLLRLLGTCSLQRDGDAAPVAIQKRRLELLAMLALARSAGVTRERAQAYLWPESNREKSRHALDQLIYATRRAVELDVVRCDSGILALNPGTVDVDLWRFSDAVARERWQDAIEAYTGHLLEGFHAGGSHDLEQWVEAERQRLRREYQRSLESLAAEARNAGDHSAATALWLKLAAMEPLSSRIAVEVIKTYAADGNVAAGVRHARLFQKNFVAELGVQPPAEVEQMALSLTKAVHADSIVGPPEVASVAAPGGAPAGNTAAEQRRRHTPTAAADSSARAKRERRSGRIWTMAGRRAAFGISLAAAGTIWVVNTGSPPPSSTHSAPSRADHTIDPAAHRAYLRGMNAWSERSKPGLDTAVIEFRRALELEPAYADAHAGLASAYVLLGYFGYRPSGIMFSKAKAAARSAIALDSTNARAYAALGFELAGELRFADSEAALRRSIALDPDLATAHHWYGIVLNMLGRLPEAVRETRIAARLDPLSLQVQNTYATFLNAAGRPAEALREYQRFVGEEPDSAWIRRNPWLLVNMARVYASNGRFAEALRTMDMARRLVPAHPRPLWDLASIYLRMGREDEAERAFALADTSNAHFAAYRAFVYAQEGRLDSAFAWFSRVREWGMPTIVALRSSPDLAALRRDPRFGGLLRSIGLPP